MAQCLNIHPHNPQPRLIREVVAILRGGGVIVYPTEACYVLGCLLGEKLAVERLLRMNKIDVSHPLTLVCHDLSTLAKYAKVNNTQFRFLKKLIPGCYTFILEATREVPKRILASKRGTIGLCIPDHNVALMLLEELDEPILTTTLLLSEDHEPMQDPIEIRLTLEQHVDLVIDSGVCGGEVASVIDITDEPSLLHRGKGDVTVIGF